MSPWWSLCALYSSYARWSYRRRLESLGCLLGGVYVRCNHRMPGGVIVGDPGLCCYGPAFNVMCDVNCSRAITSHCLLTRGVWGLIKNGHFVSVILTGCATYRGTQKKKNSTRSVDVTHVRGTQQRRPESPTITPGMQVILKVR